MDSRDRDTVRRPERTRRDALAVAGVLALLTLAIYGQTARFDFVGLDDAGYVARNPRVLSGLSLEGCAWAFTTTHEANWHPLTWLSLMLDASLWGTGPRGFHLTSIALHLAGTLLLFHAWRRMTGATWKSAFVAAMFAVHPLHVESVAWIAERKDVLSALFAWLTLLAYARYAERPSASRYAAVAGTYALGLLAKPMLVTLPLVLLLLDYWPLGRVPAGPRRAAVLGRRLLEKVPLLVLAAASSVATLLAQSAEGSVAGLAAFPLGVRLSNAAVSYVVYLLRTVWPAGLAVPYPYAVASLTVPRVAAALLVLGAATAAAVRAAKGRPYVLTGWLWYLGTLVPVIGIVQVGIQARADRYTYLPLVGIFVIAAWGVPDLLGITAQRAGRRARALGLLGVAVTVALAAAAHAQVRHFEDAVALFARALAVTRDNAVAHNGMGLALFERGRLDEAVAHYESALRISPDYAEAHANLALALARSGRLDEAEAHYRRALELRPADPRSSTNLGALLLERGRVGEAAKLFDDALREAPSDPVAHRWLGAILAHQGRDALAVDHLRAAIAGDPGDAAPRVDLGTVLMRRGDLAGAEIEFREALRISPGSASAHKNLAAVLASQGKLAEAATHLREVLRLHPDDQGARQNLERIEAEAGRR